MANKYIFKPDYAVPPGETLLEVMESLDITQAELVRRIGRPKKTISGIINGKISITAETALQLEKVLGVPASFWLKLEYNYQEALARIKENTELEHSLDWLKIFPVKQMVSYGWINECSNKVEYVKELLSYHGVATIEAWREKWRNIAVAFRKSEAFETSYGALTAWLRKGELEAQKIKCGPWDKTEFTKALKQIRFLTIEDPGIFESKIQKLCAESGVAVVFIKELPKCPVSGVARWLTKDKALIQMSLRYKTDDHFWFTFFHEAGHILQSKKREIFMEGISQNHVKEETAANTFASEFLVPKEALQEFIKKTNPYFSAIKVEGFAKSLGISPGIVVGRLQHEKVIPPQNLNKLKVKFQWADE